MEKQLNVPKLRFPEFKGEWEKKKLEKFSISISSGKSKMKDLEGKFPLFGSTGVIGRTDNYDYSGKSILIARVGANAGKLYIVDGNFSVTDNTLILNLNCSIDIDFVFNYLVKTNLNKLVFGSGQPLITAGQLKNLDVSFPSLPEQSRIASFFSAIDEKLKLETQRLTALKQYKKGVMQKLFSQELRFKDENGKEFPDWEVKKLGEIIDYKNGGSYENLVCDNGKYFLITLNSLDVNGKLKPDHKRVNATDNSLKKGDLVMVLSDVAHGFFLGLTDIIPSNNYVLNQRMGGLKPKEDIDFNSYYLKTYINYNQKYFKLKGQGSSQKNLGKEDVLFFKIECPKINEQTKIANFLSSIDDKIDQAEKRLQLIQMYKKGLLQQMFV